MPASWSGIGEGDRHWFLGTLATIRIPAEASEGRFALIEFLLPCGASPPLHTHPQDETYVVLEGEMTFVAGEERFTLSAGGAGTLPAGEPHTFRVDSDGARALTISTPAGIERMVRDAGVVATAATLPPPDTPRPSPDEIAAIFERHQVSIAGPALGPAD